MRAGAEWEESGLVFTTRHGKWLDPQNVYRDSKLVLERAGLPSTIRLHDLRHAMATHWLVAGESVNVVSARLGHSDASFTWRVYGHVLPGHQADAATRMETLLLDKNGPQTGRRDFQKPQDKT